MVADKRYVDLSTQVYGLQKPCEGHSASLFPAHFIFYRKNEGRSNVSQNLDQSIQVVFYA